MMSSVNASPPAGDRQSEGEVGGTCSAGPAAAALCGWPSLGRPHPHRFPLRGLPAGWCRGSDPENRPCVLYTREVRKVSASLPRKHPCQSVLGEFGICTLSAADQCQRAVNRQFEKPCQPRSSNTRDRPPRRTGRQHIRAVNWRKPRIRTSRRGVRAEPWGFRAHPEPDLIQTENARTTTRGVKCLRYAGVPTAPMPSTKRAVQFRTGDGLAPQEVGFSEYSLNVS
jgi:hypothetical protein